MNIPTSASFEARLALFRQGGQQALTATHAAHYARQERKQGKPQAQPRLALAKRPRDERDAPRESRQYAPEIATTIARDDRLTPQAKALGLILRARCGKGRHTDTTVGTLGRILARSMRSIQRYLGDLVRWGYVTVEKRVNRYGMDVGLRITVTERLLPFFHDHDQLAAWLAERGDALPAMPGKLGTTNLSPNNQAQSLPSMSGVLRTLRSRVGRMPFAPFGRA